MTTRFQNLFLASALFAGIHQTARAADTSSWVVNKHQQFNQTNSGPSVIQNQNGGPYTFEASANASGSGLILGENVQLPNGTSQSASTTTNGSGGFGLTPSFSTLAALDAAYPVGQYVLTITNLNDGIKRVTNNLPSSVYPSTPHVANYDAAQNINPAADFKLSWDAFTNGTAGDLIQLQVSSAGGNTVFSTPLNFGQGTLTGLSNSVVIPAGTLTINQTYSATLWFYKVINVDTSSYPGANGYTIFWKRTFFNLQTANPFGMFPIAANAAGIELAASGTNYLAAMLSGTNVCVQIFSTNGAAIGSLNTIGSGTSFPLAAYGGGKYLVYWDDNFIDSGGVYGQFISAGGNVVGSLFSIGMPGVQGGGLGAGRALAFDGTNFLAVFQVDNGTSQLNDIYGQVVTSAGATNTAFLISSQHQNGREAAAVFGKSNYLVVWQSNNNDTGTNNKTYGEFVTSSGFAGSPFQISQTASTDQDPIAIAFDGTNYLVAWMWDVGTGEGAVTNWDIYGRLVSQTGTYPGSELHLVTDPGSQYWPSLTFDGANYLLAWGDNPGGAALSSTTNYVRFQFLNRSASAIGPEFNLFTTQGTNVPAFNTALFGGNKIAAIATLGSPTTDTNGDFNGFASASVYGAFIPASTAAPAFAAPGSLAGTQFSLTLAGTPGINYAVQVATNLSSANWVAFATNSPTNGTFTFTDTSATNKSRFYRAVKQ